MSADASGPAAPPAAAIGAFECVIGLEVHVQLKTRTKLFCACENRHGSEPNTHICPVCTGHPGTLPVLNEAALLQGMRGGLALRCAIAAVTRFDRKHYFYPDLPKGYQISQLAAPLCSHGALEIPGDEGTPRRVPIVRAHLEEDAGKSTHPAGSEHSLVDLNRAGVPLLEIVSGPDLRSPQEAYRYLAELRRRLRYAGISDCDMEKGSLRCDANVSIRPRGATHLMERVEIKNLNSFRNVERALAYEIQRQTEVVNGGATVVQQTRSFRENDGTTLLLRSKEDVEDYRYFPEPDLPPFAIDAQLVEDLRAALPEMPDALRARLAALGLRPDIVELVVAEPEHAAWFERCVEAGADPMEAANYFAATVLADANERGVRVDEVPLDAAHAAQVIAMVGAGRLSHQAARKVLQHMLESGDTPDAAIKRLGLEQVSDRAELEPLVDQVIAHGERAVAEFRAGKEAALNALVGAVMKASKGKANPNLAREILLERLRA